MKVKKPAPKVVEKVMRALAHAITGLELPAVEKISEHNREDPFKILISTILSARTQDATTHAASTRLFRRARTPRTMATLTEQAIETLIYPVSFYRYKARYVKACCEMLVTRFGGHVPRTMEELVLLPGVGRKTANVILSVGFDRPGLPVDTHVTRLSQRLGLTEETDPVRIEQQLNAMLPAREWGDFSLRMILHGRRVCVARTPRCEECVLNDFCPSSRV